MLALVDGGTSHAIGKSDIDFVCNSVRFTGKYTDHGQTWSDLQIMTLAKARTMDKGGRAEQFLNHYLAGSGEPIHFSLRTLMEEDPGYVLASLVQSMRRGRR